MATPAIERGRPPDESTQRGGPLDRQAGKHRHDNDDPRGFGEMSESPHQLMTEQDDKWERRSVTSTHQFLAYRWPRR